jgi:diguanylate cyclase (GGDEF)-like protein/PAS domain S-box-containing protein
MVYAEIRDVRRIAHHRYPENQMKGEDKTRKQLLEELVVLRERITQFEKSDLESKRAEQKLRETRDYAESIVDTVREPLVVLDADLNVISANRSFYETFKVKPGETEGQLLYDLGNREWNIPKLRELLEEILPRHTAFDNFEMEHEFKTIGRRVMHLNARRVYRKTNETHSILLAIEDMTERKRAEKEIYDLAYYDSMTRLPNRQLFGEHLSRALAHAKRHKRLLAVLFLDLDHFKQINDTHGHHVGDLLLRSVADRLKKILRKSDIIARHETDDSISYVSRFGGDEFVLLLTDLKQPHDAANVAQRSLYELSKAYVLEEREIFVSSSIGISVYPADGKDVNTLIKNADAAMYHAKNQGRNNFQFYAGYMNTTISRRLTLDSVLG